MLVMVSRHYNNRIIITARHYSMQWHYYPILGHHSSSMQFGIFQQGCSALSCEIICIEAQERPLFSLSAYPPHLAGVCAKCVGGRRRVSLAHLKFFLANISDCCGGHVRGQWSYSRDEQGPISSGTPCPTPFSACSEKNLLSPHCRDVEIGHA